MLVYGIFGDPIEHSLSPAMQNAAFQALGIEACYHAFRVAEPRLKAALEGAAAMGFGGVNLTIPLKEKAMELVSPHPTAAEMGAVNTVSFGPEVVGYNTDGLGAKRALQEAGVELKGEKVLIIGAGGAARAIAFTLQKEGSELAIANRNISRARELASKVKASAHSLDDLAKLVPWADLIVNTTSVGMKDGDPRIVDGSLLRKDQTVFDVVYNRETELLKDAALAGCRRLDGVMMLVYQGAEAFRIWTGRKAPVKVMEQAVREALAGRGR